MDAQNQWQLELKLHDGVNVQQSVQVPRKWKLRLSKWQFGDTQHVQHIPPPHHHRGSSDMSNLKMRLCRHVFMQLFFTFIAF